MGQGWSTSKAILCFHRHSRFVRRETAQSPTTPAPPHPRRGIANSPSLAKEGQGWSTSKATLCFHRHSRFVRRETAQSPTTPAPPHPRRGMTNSPPWLRRGQGWSTSKAILCFHRHSRFVPVERLLLTTPIAAGADPCCVGSAVSRRDRSGLVAQYDRTAPSAHCRRSKATSAPARFSTNLSKRCRTLKPGPLPV